MLAKNGPGTSHYREALRSPGWLLLLLGWMVLAGVHLANEGFEYYLLFPLAGFLIGAWWRTRGRWVILERDIAAPAAGHPRREHAAYRPR